MKNKQSDKPMTMIPKGVKDLLPVRAAKVEFLEGQLREVFLRWGFHRIIPSGLEFLGALEQGMGAGLQRLTFRFDDRQSGELVAIPPDITPQIARIFATRMQELPLPVRLYYSGRVLRHVEEQAGKDREIAQAGAELIGAPDAEADGEMIAMAVECLKSVGAEDFTIDIGQVEFFRGVMEELPLTGEAAAQVQRAIAHKDARGLERLLAEHDLSPSIREATLALPRLFGGREVLDLAFKVAPNERSRNALENLARVLDVLARYGVEEYVTLDLGEIRGLDYHTGVSFQGFVPGAGSAVLSGGRYDNLTACYGRPAPATGFTVNIFSLLFALDRSLDARVKRHDDLLIVQQGAVKADAQRLAARLRSKGLCAVHDLIDRDPAASRYYAQVMNFRYVAILTDKQSVRLIATHDNTERMLSIEELCASDFSR